MKLLDLTSAEEVHRRDMRRPAYLLCWLAQWPRNQVQLRRLLRGETKA